MTALQYDSRRRRLWIAGQRCHHGATGALLSAAAGAVLLATRAHVAGLGAVLAAGGVLMAHDWHDRGVWFQPGHQHDG
ncbi:hypothetical protein FSW04_07945 [Baekduia soli]|uniref:Uncharacterized protein n=1 Tax=Baekduia soli TaxID=496014 RepID=A0A5B8U380_9ACTN|nr:hypothetical protein [Baekduia soli]QEC47517.1 hypothetical protein FSW04_07945 [Baekduia soli]